MKTNRSFTILLIALITIFSVHLIHNHTQGVRVDLTETQLYSLTEGTHQIIEKMQNEGVKPIEVRLYFSHTAGKSLPQMIKGFVTYENYIRNLLKEYERYGEGKIKVSFIDPVPDSDEAQDATDFGLDGKPINQYGDLFFFGMVFQTQTGSRDVIEFLSPDKQETIEYEISKRIYNLIWPTKKRIGVVSGIEPLPDNNPYMNQLLQAQGKAPSQPWSSMEVLKEQYEVSLVDAEADQYSKDDYDLLMIIHPRDFSEKQLWAINEWVVTGGNTILFLDPYSIEDQPEQNPNNPWASIQYKPASSLAPLTEAWGLARPEDQFVVDYELGAKRLVDRRGHAEKVITDLMIEEKHMAAVTDPDMPITNGLSTLRFFLAGALEKTDKATAEFTPVLKTTTAGATLTVLPGFNQGGNSLHYTDLNTPTKFLDQYQPAEKEVVLAYLIRGQLADAYPEGLEFPKEAPKPPPGLPPGMKMPAPEGAEMIKKEPLDPSVHGEASVLVFSDVDFITDQLAFQRSFFGLAAANDNYKVLLNSVDYLLGAKELMNVRSKQRIRRPFELFDRIEAQADTDMLEQERRIRTDIEQFQDDLREKQRGINEKNAALLQKKLQDEIDTLNTKINDGNRKLREIRKQKRARLEGVEFWVRSSMIGAVPLLVCIFGLANVVSRRNKRNVTGR